MTTSIADNLNTTDDQSYTASGTSNLATSGGPVSLTLNSDRKDDNLYHVGSDLPGRADDSGIIGPIDASFSHF